MLRVNMGFNFAEYIHIIFSFIIVILYIGTYIHTYIYSVRTVNNNTQA